MKKSLILITLTGTLFSACTTMNKTETATGFNPLLASFNTPYEVPPFHLIKNEHFKPAILEAIRVHEKEIEAIANNPEAPDFENTIVAFENAGQLLNRINTIFSNLNSANTNPELQAIAKEVAPELSRNNDNIFLNEKLFARVKAVWENTKNKYTPEQAKLLERKYKAFQRNGANLEDAGKERLREINKQLSVLSLQYGENVLAENNGYKRIIEHKKDLAGLPAEVITAAADDAKAMERDGKWVFTLQNASVMPFLQYADNRDLRREIWTAYQNRGRSNNQYNNNDIVLKLAGLRAEKAQLLGYESHAAFVLEERMAKTPANVYNLLDQLWKPALAKAKAEEADIKAMMKADGINDNVQPFDWRYYTEKIRKHRYDLDEQELKPYLSLENVRNGIFKVTENLYGLKYKQLFDVPKYHEDVTVWEVMDRDGSHLGILYMDMHPRASKRGGAWMTSYRKQQMEKGKRKAPVISIVCNFSKPTADAPALLTFDETTTFFHEFGHALHGLLSNVNYESLAGTSVFTDFVELPSQIMENWAAEPEVLKMYAKHYKTGEVIPDRLIKKLQESATFDQGFATVEYLAASYLDMAYHNAPSGSITNDVTAFENATMKRLGLPDAIIPRYRSTYFTHIYSGGYSAGYYSYIWSGVLDTDAFDAFKSKSLFDAETAKSFRSNILERGGTADPMQLYTNFRGSEPSIRPLLNKRGLDAVR